uniref:J domain-containing protein n=3 Tax=Aegilops tauschii subsp. strangulata TaxID=200361 RepID=A0A453GD57_AEGTS
DQTDMECNKDEAIRSKEMAERKYKVNDFAGARKFALKAKGLFDLEGIDQMIVALDVHLRSLKKFEGENDWYGILEVSTWADEETIRKQYKKLALQTHPDKNSFVGADSAFNLISDAWNVLSDKNKRILHDQRRHMSSLRVLQNNSQVSVDNTSSSSMPSMNGFCRQNTGPASPPNVPPPNIPKLSTFWTVCISCRMNFEYPRQYVNQYMICPECHKPFKAEEVPPPPTSSHTYQPKSMDTNTSRGRTACPGEGMAGTGVASGSRNHHNPMQQRCSFQGSAGGAHTFSHSVQQTHGTVSGSSGSSIPRKAAATKEKEAAKKRYKKVAPQSTSSGLDGDSSSQNKAKMKARSTDRASGAKRRKETSNCPVSAGSSFIKEMEKLDMRNLLINKMKLQLRDKLEEFNRKKADMENGRKMQTSQRTNKAATCSTAVDAKKMKRTQRSSSVHPEEDNGKKLTSERKRAEKRKHAGSEEMGSWEWKKPEIRLFYTRRSRREQEPSPDEMLVPDADFYAFGDHSGNSFQKDQVWATYDEEDGMPRYYALIQTVHSRRPFKVTFAFLKADNPDEFGASDWLSCGFSKTCGDFKPGASEDADELNKFSHLVACQKGPGRRIIRILPRKGDIWALYQNWSADWDELVPDETMYKYDLVQVLDSYSPSEGLSVMPIEKVPGFVSVFKPLSDPAKSRRIPEEEMTRFSHQVPFHILTGEEAHNSPKGCYELDPGSTPKELLQVV